MQPRPADMAAELRGRLMSHRRFATLRWRMLSIVAATILGLLVIVYIPLRIFLLGSFVSLEQQLLLTDLDRAASAIADDLHDLDLLNASYSVWDDTYAFVETPNQEYIEKNYYDDFFIDNRLNLVLIADRSGRVVFGKAFDRASSSVVPLPQRFQQFTNHEILLDHSSPTSTISFTLPLRRPAERVSRDRV